MSAHTSTEPLHESDVPVRALLRPLLKLLAAVRQHEGERVSEVWRQMARALVLLMMWAAPASGQLTYISVDLKNNFSLSQMPQPQGRLSLQSHGQYYVFGIKGYAASPKLLSFDLQTSLADYSSTSKTLSATQSVRSRNLGYYNFSLSLLPNNGFPLTLYASRAEAKNASSTNLALPVAVATQTSNEVETMGLRWSVAKKTYTPQTELTVERSLNRGVLTHQKRDTVVLRMSNSNGDGTSQYSFQYSGSRSGDDLFGVKQTRQELQFYGNSKLSARADFYSNATYSIWDRTTNRSGELGLTVRQTEHILHQLRLRNATNRFQSMGVSKNSSSGFNHETFIAFSGRTQGTFGVNYTLQQSELGGHQSSTDRGQARAQLSYNGRLAFTDLTASLGTNLGFESLSTQGRTSVPLDSLFGQGRSQRLEGYTTGGRKFAQQTQVNLGGRFPAFHRVQFSVQEGFSLATTAYFGSTVHNTIGVNATTTLIPHSVVGMEIAHNYSRYLDFAVVAPRSTMTASGRVATRITPTTVAEVQHTESWIRAWYLERSSRTSATVVESGFFRSLTLQVRGEHALNSVTKLKVVTMEGIADYQFYAFTCRAKFSLYSIAGTQTRSVMLEIRRPLAFYFR